jgi:hypothetical protein
MGQPCAFLIQILNYSTWGSHECIKIVIFWKVVPCCLANNHLSIKLHGIISRETILLSSSSVRATAPCGLWPVEQYLSIFPYLSPTLSIFSPPALEDLFLLFLSILSSSSPSFQFLSEDLFGHSILLHSLQVTQLTYLLPLYAFYYIFSFTQLF